VTSGVVRSNGFWVDRVDACTKCNAPIQWSSQHCPSCGHFLGFPNVQAANQPEERAALDARLEEAFRGASTGNLAGDLDQLIQAANRESGVIVSMPAEVALQLVTSSGGMHYVNYNALVASEVRSPALFANDSQRAIVAGALFASFGNKIVYGAISFNGRGLATYGDIFCRLRRVAVEDRTSFLEMNSYDFVRKFGYENYPKGYRADWPNRSKLVAIKLTSNGKLRHGQTVADWQDCIVVSDGKNRNLDDFVEAHVFGPFNIHSVEDMIAAQDVKPNRRESVELALAAFHSFRAGIST
jgi:hypothetical protein